MTTENPVPWPGDISKQVLPGTRFLLQIVDVTAPHVLARFPAGGALEREFIEVCTASIVSRGGGLLKSEAHVRAAILAGITDAILALKRETRQLPHL